MKTLHSVPFKADKLVLNNELDWSRFCCGSAVVLLWFCCGFAVVLRSPAGSAVVLVDLMNPFLLEQKGPAVSYSQEPVV